MQETQEVWVRPLGQEDPMEEEMATHSSVLARHPCLCVALPLVNLDCLWDQQNV